MKNRQWSTLVLGLLVIVSYEAIASDEQDFEVDSAEMALFEVENESEADAIMADAAQTAIMQQPLDVKPISPAMLLVRKVWDRMLIAYLWLQARYLAVYRYFKRGAPQQQSMQ